jgi:hypothetical protein
VVQAALLELSSLIESGEISTSGWDTEVANGFVAGQDSLYNFPRQILDDIEQEM